MNLNLTQKVAIITGGTSGIGEAIAYAFAQENAIPIIVGRDAKRGEMVLQKLLKICSEAAFFQTELAEPQNCKATIDFVLEGFGRLDILVNNAGGNDSVSLTAGPDAFMKSIQQNLLHVYALVHFGLEALKISKGNIINIGSKVAQTGQGNTSGYAAAKGGMQALTREWAVDLRTFGIRVNEVVPAEVLTLSYEKWIATFENPQEKLKSITKHIPFGNRFTTPEEIADMVVFLSSEKASHITGQHIFVDGGYTHLDRSLDF